MVSFVICDIERQASSLGLRPKRARQKRKKFDSTKNRTHDLWIWTNKQMDAFQKTDYAVGAHSKWFTGMFPSSPPDSLSHTDSFSSWHSILLYPYYNRVILCFCDSKPRGVLSINGPHAHDMDRHVQRPKHTGEGQRRAQRRDHNRYEHHVRWGVEHRARHRPVVHIHLHVRIRQAEDVHSQTRARCPSGYDDRVHNTAIERPISSSK